MCTFDSSSGEMSSVSYLAVLFQQWPGEEFQEGQQGLQFLLPQFQVPQSLEKLLSHQATALFTVKHTRTHRDRDRESHTHINVYSRTISWTKVKDCKSALQEQRIVEVRYESSRNQTWYSHGKSSLPSPLSWAPRPTVGWVHGSARDSDYWLGLSGLCCWPCWCSDRTHTHTHIHIHRYTQWSMTNCCAFRTVSDRGLFPRYPHKIRKHL